MLWAEADSRAVHCASYCLEQRRFAAAIRSFEEHDLGVYQVLGDLEHCVFERPETANFYSTDWFY